MRVVVVDKKGQPLNIEVGDADTANVAEVKQLVSKKCNIQYSHVELSFEGLQLADETKLQDYGIGEGCSLTLRHGRSFQHLAGKYPLKGRKIQRFNTFDKSDMDKILQKSYEEELDQTEEGLATWITSVLDKRVETPLCTSLLSGQELCELLEVISGEKVMGQHRGGGVTAHGTRSTALRSIHSAENIALFCGALKKQGISEQDLMTPSQLEKGERKPVIGCLMALLRLAHPKGIGEISGGLLTAAKLPKGYVPQKKYIGRSQKTFAEREAEKLAKEKKIRHIAEYLTKQKGSPEGVPPEEDEDIDTKHRPSGNRDEDIKDSAKPSTWSYSSMFVATIALVCILGPPIWSAIIANKRRR